MYLKWFGVFFIVAGCGGVGFMMAYHARREIRMLHQLISAMEYMSCELSYRLTPLPELVRKAGSLQDGLIRRAFHAFADELDSQISPDAASCMESAIAKCTDLPQSIAAYMGQIGKNLGIFDLEGQQKSIASLKEECFIAIRELEDNKIMRTRGYQTLGLCAGAALAVLLI